MKELTYDVVCKYEQELLRILEEYHNISFTVERGVSRIDGYNCITFKSSNFCCLDGNFHYARFEGFCYMKIQSKSPITHFKNVFVPGCLDDQEILSKLKKHIRLEKIKKLKKLL